MCFVTITPSSPHVELDPLWANPGVCVCECELKLFADRFLVTELVLGAAGRNEDR